MSDRRCQNPDDPICRKGCAGNAACAYSPAPRAATPEDDLLPCPCCGAKPERLSCGHLNVNGDGVCVVCDAPPEPDAGDVAKLVQRIDKWLSDFELALDCDADMIIRDSRAKLESLATALAAKERECDALKLQAQSHAMEARTANATIAEIYQLCTGATGEPGNWNGAEPVRAALAGLRRDAERKDAALRSAREFISNLRVPQKMNEAALQVFVGSGVLKALDAAIDAAKDASAGKDNG